MFNDYEPIKIICTDGVLDCLYKNFFINSVEDLTQVLKDYKEDCDNCEREFSVGNVEAYLMNYRNEGDMYFPEKIVIDILNQSSLRWGLFVFFAVN